MTYGSSEQDNTILEENHSSSFCEKTLEGTLEEQSHDDGMVETHLNQYQVSFKPI